MAQEECKDFALAVLISEAGEDTSLPEDMQRQVEWPEKQYCQRLGDDSAKLLQIYRLLAGQVDDVLEYVAAPLFCSLGSPLSARLRCLPQVCCGTAGPFFFVPAAAGRQHVQHAHVHRHASAAQASPDTRRVPTGKSPKISKRTPARRGGVWSEASCWTGAAA